MFNRSLPRDPAERATSGFRQGPEQGEHRHVPGAGPAQGLGTTGEGGAGGPDVVHQQDGRPAQGRPPRTVTARLGICRRRPAGRPAWVWASQALRSNPRNGRRILPANMAAASSARSNPRSQRRHRPVGALHTRSAAPGEIRQGRPPGPFQERRLPAPLAAFDPRHQERTQGRAARPVDPEGVPTPPSPSCPAGSVHQGASGAAFLRKGHQAGPAPSAQARLGSGPQGPQAAAAGKIQPGACLCIIRPRAGGTGPSQTRKATKGV